MLISIDHGNKQIKTNRRTFVAGLHESDTRPPFGQNILHYNGKYYTLSEQRIPYMRDKTVDERYFILTLFAVAFELALLSLLSLPAQTMLRMKLQMCSSLSVYPRLITALNTRNLKTIF